MAVCSVLYQGQPRGMRAIQPPKEASARGWWNEVRKTYRELELAPWGLVKERVKFSASEETIFFDGPAIWVAIARKRNMR